MTTELEKQFFETFGIKPKYTYLVTDTFYTNNSHTYTATKDDLIDYFEGKNCGRYKVIKVYKNYPQITDRHYLELICLLGYFEIVNKPNNCEELKNYILEWCLDLDYSEIIELKHQVQKLFKGE